MQVLVDADILVYRAGFATEYPQYTVCWDDYASTFQYKKEAEDYAKELPSAAESEIRVSTVLESVENALYIVDSQLGGIAKHFGVRVKDLTLYLTGDNNFRKEVAVTKPYKGNRTKPKPTHYADIRGYMLAKHKAILVDDEEADDAMGHEQYTQWYFNPESSCIVTIDKDLDMIPGRHYNFVKDLEYYVEEDEADRFFLYQLICGDSSDNIPGIPGMADKKSTSFLADIPLGQELSAILGLYMDSYGDKGYEVMEEMATLLWIRRAPLQHWTNYWGEKGTWQRYDLTDQTNTSS
jgi:hypothetical protein